MIENKNKTIPLINNLELLIILRANKLTTIINRFDSLIRLLYLFS